ncbi:MAG: hypothetical protein AMXMBFR13_09130 [Phycisphaerae bacterium]
MDWQSKFTAATDYRCFLDTYGKPGQPQRWRAVYEQLTLTDEQRALLLGFTRRMNVLCLAGVWCGDCVNQCPILQRIAEATDRIELRFLDRDEHMDVQRELSINGGHRVPMVVFLSEDYHECGRYGDRTLSKYRQLTQTLQGAACPTGTAASEDTLLKLATAEWLAEFERVQLMLRLSPRLREKYRD